VSSNPQTVARRPLTRQQAQQLDTALSLFQQGALDRARDLLNTLLAEAPTCVEALHLRALCAVRQGDVAGAEQAFSAALTLNPQQPQLLCNYATFLRRQGRPLEAIDLWRRAVLVVPTLASAWIELGVTELDLQRLVQAQSAFERALSLGAEDVRVWQGLAAVHRAAGRLVQARAALERAVALAPQSVPAWINLGAVCRLLGDSRQALACYRQAQALGDESFELADALSGVLLDLGQVEDAIAQARRTVQAFPEAAAGRVTLAHLRWEYDAEVPDPLEELDQAAAQRPGDLALQIECVGLLLRAHRTSRALQRLHACAAHWGQLPFALQLLHADALEQAGQVQEAAALYARLYRETGGRDPGFLNRYARHLFRQQRPDTAAACAQQALMIDPRDQEALAYLGTAWRLLGDAREHWLCDVERLIGVLEIEPPPGYPDVPTFLEQLQATLLPLHQAVREPLQQSLRTGSQTPGRLFGRPDPVIAAAEHALRSAVRRWLARLPQESMHPFLRERQDDIRVTGSWSVCLKSSGHHVSHIHPEGWISSAFYVALPESVRHPTAQRPDAGSIQFGQPPQDLGVGLPPTRVIAPHPGQLVLFPSYFWHGTVPFEDRQPRLTIAFDMVPANR